MLQGMTEIFRLNLLSGRDKSRAAASLKKGYLPAVTYETEQLGCRIRQTVFGNLIDGDRLRTARSR